MGTGRANHFLSSLIVEHIYLFDHRSNRAEGSRQSPHHRSVAEAASNTAIFAFRRFTAMASAPVVSRGMRYGTTGTAAEASFPGLHHALAWSMMNKTVSSGIGTKTGQERTKISFQASLGKDQSSIRMDGPS